MEKRRTYRILGILAVIWLLSLVIVAQCAIHETHQRPCRADAIGAFSSFHFPTTYSNTPVKGLSITFKGGFKKP